MQQGKTEAQPQTSLSNSSHLPSSNQAREIAADVGMVLQLADGSIQACNPYAEQLLGITAEKMQGCTNKAWQTIYEDGSPFPSEAHPPQVALQTGQPVSNVIMGFIKPNGEVVWLKVSANPLFQAHQSTPYAVVTSFTCSQTAPIDSTSQQLLVTLESISDAFFSLDLDWRFTYVNPQMTRMVNRSFDDLIGKNIWEEFPAAVGTVFEQEYRRAIAEQVTVSFEAFYPPFNVWYGVRAYPMASGLAVYFQDITEQKNTQAAILQQQQTASLRLAEIEALYATAPVGLCFVDTDLRYIRANEHLAKMNGVSIEEHLGHTLREVLPEMADDLEPLYQQVIETGDPIINLEISGTNRAKPGVRREWLVSYYPLKDAERVLGINIVVQEITERKQAELALQAANQQVINTLETISDAFSAFDSEWRYTYVNHAAEKLLQRSRNELLGKSVWEIFPAEGQSDSLVYQELQRAVAEQVPVRFEDFSLSLNFYAEVSAYPSSQGLLVYFRDISERKFSEIALRQSEERYRILFESIDEGCCVIEMLYDENNKPCDYRFLEINPAFEKQTGLQDAVGKTMCQLVPNMETNWYEIYGQIVETGIAQRFENRAEAMNRWYDVYAFRIGLAENRKVAVLFKDISDAKLLEQQKEKLLAEAEAARVAAETANRIKDEFLAVLSHELRSPLNPILGWAKLLQTGKMNPSKTTEALKTIERNATLQSQLINDLLDVSRILQGKFSLNMSPVKLERIIAAALETVQLAALAKAIQIETILEPVGQVSGDAARLQQIAWNLLSNAVKFTPKDGRIEVKLVKVEDYAQITVSDTGKGISPDFLDYVFERFRQEDSATTRKFGGLGLGLAIVRQLAELHGGTVWAESAGEGLGAAFTVRLPLLNEKSRTSHDKFVKKSFSPDSLAGFKIIVVDDEADSRNFVAFVLEQAGAQVIALSSGLEALQVMQNSQYNLLVSDIGMPEMDGYMLLKQARLSQANKQIPAIALTAYAGEYDQKQAILAGFQEHLSKPVDPEKLVQVIKTALT
ncbi:MAG: PAS domain-containing protein [Coleofasciculaceae cyanobacterium]